MFHQVRLLPADRPLLRFLWRDMNRDRPPDVYEWQVLPFGTTCSPCCATFALQKHVMDHSQPEEDVHVAINKSFYVDNCLQSLACPVAAKTLVDKLRHLLADGGFELRQWASNDPDVIQHLPPDLRSSSCELWLSQGQSDIQEPALGLHWNCKSDTLTYKHRHIDCSVATMRNIYRVLASQYDPLGYIVPYTTRAKVIVRHLWEKQRGWDDPQLPEVPLQKWYAWEAELEQLHKITLPRCYTSHRLDQPNCMRDIHVFCDASEQAYGSVAYLRTEGPDGEVEVAFLAARSRVAPKKQQSIPRLELCAALTGAQLYKVISSELTLPIRSCILWSDSATVLTWLSSDSCRYKVFVGTRVAEIQEMTGTSTWKFVPSKDNPADDITRGLTIQDISKGSRWTNGPEFLKLAPDCWPHLPTPPQSDPEGVDCFGPYSIKIRRSNEKRRGKPKEILCDQGTNFRGGERELQVAFQALHPNIREQLARQQIEFIFNPPGSPHFGGCWEREIRSLKTALQVVIGAQIVSEEVLHTVLIEIEGMLNSKPLGYTSSEVADPDPVTPNYLLMGRRDASLPQVIYDSPEILGRRRWRHSQILADYFWQNFLKYYLPGLQARQKWQTESANLQVGDVVMIVDNQLPRALWPVGEYGGGCEKGCLTFTV
ncbi:uncharacterized protein LOC110367597 [Fundulus heteroclitus]|uniref:uncharacterized protein LOC110367597 n=1 Tax=Fundulus heteroclitus TaxID=8078 RepID=UPI00165A1F36|nr:uncharacterized protein LOC110367597 [Fundulus heteroclitus]